MLFMVRERKKQCLGSLSGTPPEPRLLCPSALQPMAQQGERPQLKKAGRAAICHSMRGEHNHGHISMINDLFWGGESLWIPLLLFRLLGPKACAWCHIITIHCLSLYFLVQVSPLFSGYSCCHSCHCWSTTWSEKLCERWESKKLN